MPGHNNWRLERIANSICACVLTDGFCGPRHNQDCRCWTAARAALQGFEQQADPVLVEAWPDMPEWERRPRLQALCKAIRERRDDLTAGDATMDIRVEKAPSASIVDFARKHELILKVEVRKDVPPGAPGRYTAKFDRVERKEGCFLRSVYGNGATPRDAIIDYIPLISCKKLVFNAYGDDRREIDAPYLDPASALQVDTEVA